MKQHGVLDIIAEEASGKSYKTFKYSFDRTNYSPIDYDDIQEEITWKQYGETIQYKKPINMKPLADKWISHKPIFTYFLDGSRRIYKVDDLAINKKVYPVIAGQIGISCCKRINHIMHKHKFNKILAIALPDVANTDGWGNLFFNGLCDKINQEDPHLKRLNLAFSNVLPYSTRRDEQEAAEKKGIAVIQDLMIENEIKMVSDMVSSKEINEENYLMKDGSLEYKVDKLKSPEAKRDFQAKYHFVVGVSKSFNPENCIDHRSHNNSDVIAALPLYYRTPVNLFTSTRLPGMYYAVWYIRIRDQKHTINAFDGILKIEKILSENDSENRIDSEIVDTISANIINERNPTCYGADSRWANHLYPIFLTETFAKSQYLSNSLFLSLF